jgi:hypothetical protein
VLLQAAASKQQFFKPQELANLVYALPLLEVQPSQQWLSGYLNACYNSLASFNSQELSLLGLGLVRLNHRPKQDWLEGYLQAVQLQLDATGSTAVAGSSNSSSSSDADMPSVNSRGSSIADDITSSSSSSAAPAEGDGTNASTSGSDQVQPAAAAAATVSRPAGFQVQGFVNVLRVMCAWGQRPGPAWQASCLAAAGRVLPELNAEGSSTLVWAMAKLQVCTQHRVFAVTAETSSVCTCLAYMLLHAMLLGQCCEEDTTDCMLIIVIGAMKHFAQFVSNPRIITGPVCVYCCCRCRRAMCCWRGCWLTRSHNWQQPLQQTFPCLSGAWER